MPESNGPEEENFNLNTKLFAYKWCWADLCREQAADGGYHCFYLFCLFMQLPREPEVSIQVFGRRKEILQYFSCFKLKGNKLKKKKKAGGVIFSLLSSTKSVKGRWVWYHDHHSVIVFTHADWAAPCSPLSAIPRLHIQLMAKEGQQNSHHYSFLSLADYMSGCYTCLNLAKPVASSPWLRQAQSKHLHSCCPAVQSEVDISRGSSVMSSAKNPGQTPVLRMSCLCKHNL